MKKPVRLLVQKPHQVVEEDRPLVKGRHYKKSIARYATATQAKECLGPEAPVWIELKPFEGQRRWLSSGGEENRYLRFLIVAPEHSG